MRVILRLWQDQITEQHMFTQLFRLNTEPTTADVERAIALLETYRGRYPELTGMAIAKCKQLRNHIEVQEDGN